MTAMSSYNTFAQFYDRLTENVDYEVRSNYISDFFCEYGNGGRRVLDLACGTGSIAQNLADKGYDIIGIDLSEEMLTLAKEKCPESIFIKADMTDFALPEKVDFCLCSLDAVNHLTELEQVMNCFECVNNSLNNGGLFVFDVNTLFKHREVLADNTFIYDEEDFFLSWDNNYTDDDIVEIYLDFFIFNGKNYDRFSERFKEKAYSTDALIKALGDDFEIIGIYDELTLNTPEDDSERLYFVCKKVN